MLDFLGYQSARDLPRGPRFAVQGHFSDLSYFPHNPHLLHLSLDEAHKPVVTMLGVREIGVDQLLKASVPFDQVMLLS